MKNWLVLISILIFCSCVRNVDKQSYKMILTKENQKELKSHCDEIEQVGNLKEYLTYIKIESDRMFDLIDNDGAYDDIVEVSDNITNATIRVRSLIGHKYNTPKWDYEVKWQINKEDFKKFVGNYLPNGLEITSVKPIKASLFGEDNNELLKNLKFNFSKKTVNLNYKGKGSSLEICQLQKTRMLLVEVNYRHTFNHNKRYYNLIHR